MKQFWIIFAFEMKNYLKNKVFVGVTALIVILLAGILSAPRVISLSEEQEDGGTDVISEEEKSELEKIALSFEESTIGGEQKGMLADAIKGAFQTDYQIVLTKEDGGVIKKQITDGDYKAAILFKDALSFTYYVNNYGLYDEVAEQIDEIVKECYQNFKLREGGFTEEQAAEILNVAPAHEVTTLGTDQTAYFFYTYIMLFALYMVILLYGQMIATNVASEKSSRAMELLITSAKPINMMFGKVLAGCLAGLAQLILIFGSAIGFYQFNEEYWGDNMIIRFIFDMPTDLLIYMMVFFLLGFLLYAFMYGAVGSMATKLEDINTSVMPLTMIFLAGFMVVIFSMTSGSVDNLLMLVCSYVPFTSPMAMFTRIAMSTVPLHEQIVSIVILIASVVGTGVISAKIYRMGVLMYGTPPKPAALLKAIRKV